MERNLYFENYLNNIQKEIFLLAYSSNYDIVMFISCYMKSNVRRKMDLPYSSWHNQHPLRIMQEVLSEYNNIQTVKEQTINKDAVEWLGFFYSKWHFITGESSKLIVRFLPAKEGLRRYYVLHQLDETEAIEISKRQYNLSRNNHRANEYKNSDESKKKYDDPIYYSFLATRILYKLTKNKNFEELNFVIDKGEYDFLSDDHISGIKSDVIDNYDTSIIDRFKIAEKMISSYSVRAISSHYFCFILSSIYEDHEDNLLEDIDKLREKFDPYNRRFEYLHFYMNGKIYVITPSNELYIYSLPVSSKDRAGILNKMKKYGLNHNNP